MKRIIYTLLALIILMGSACRSVEKMVERGNYDEALVFATKKLAGKKKKKTKYVVAVEEAFIKITNRDLQHIDRLKSSGNPEVWDEILDIYKRMDRRQTRIAPLLPLVSKDGYTAEFKFVKTTPLINNATEEAVAFHYDEAKRLIASARKGYKIDARNAYKSIKNLNRYLASYKDSEAILREARVLGTDHILVKIENRSNAILPSGFENEILNIDAGSMNSLWRRYYTTAPTGLEMDFIKKLKITAIDVSPERETINHFSEEKEIEDGWEYVLDDNGNVLKDSLGNDVKVAVTRIIRADVAEIFREKMAIVDGRLEAWDMRSNELIKTHPINVTAVFEDYASSFRGDRRALKNETKRRLKNNPMPFPTDIDMVWNSVEELKVEFKTSLRRIL